VNAERVVTGWASRTGVMHISSVNIALAPLARDVQINARRVRVSGMDF
jgi:hypothetical protein